MTVSGRRPTGRAGRIGKGLLEGLSAVGTALADGPKTARILEIDLAVKDLLQERDHLVASLIEPGDFKVSDDYDPNWRKPEVGRPVTTGNGRLTQCAGQWSASSRIHDCHPACPYLGTKHIAHEFTARD